MNKGKFSKWIILVALLLVLPAIDEKLIEQPLFRVELKSFWEKHGNLVEMGKKI